MTVTDQRILITGGAGFIGSHLADHLLATGNTVIIADDFSNGRQAWVPDEATCIDADLCTEAGVKSVVSDDLDTVFHLAARKDPNDDDPQGQVRENTTVTHRLLAACRQTDIERFAFASSSTVYGEAPRPTPEDHAPLEPISEYGASKLGEEGLVTTYGHSYGLTTVIYR